MASKPDINSHKNKTYSSEASGVLSDGTLPNDVVELQRELRAARQEIRELQRQLQESALHFEHQTHIARRFQSLFNPPTLPRIEGVNFCVKYQPCENVGGDIYDVFEMGNNCVGILVGDIAGSGLAAVLVTALTKMAFDTFRQNEYSPSVILEKVNAHLVRHTLGNQFLTAFLGVLDLETRRLKYVNAAHPAPILYSADRFELLDTDGLCCGMFEEPRLEEKEVQLKDGDHLLLFTRGLLDMAGASGKRYQDARLYHVLEGRRERPIGDIMRLIVDDFRDHLNGAVQTEDLTVVGLELTAVERKLHRIVIPSEPQQIHRVEEPILNALAARNYGERVSFGVRLALEEGVINAIKHGNRMDKARDVTITWSVDDNECVIRIEDEGGGFDPAAVPDPTLDGNIELPHGRGLVLMRAYMDEVAYNETGNCVVMKKKAPWAD
jgi:serine phosphatase RsbU (regulator of sigma subunit)/anti-sigma regulatory factor (Ser/Thr protein kinase)